MSSEKPPSIDVIIPCGPGHSEVFKRAVESVGIASDYAGVEARIIKVSDEQGLMGRSLARNHGVTRAAAEWLFFLDADDLMYPAALKSWRDELEMTDRLIEWDAIFGTITELVQGNVVERYQVPLILNYETLIAHDPFITIQMGHFVKREVALKLPFNIDMDTGEDWDYYLRLWKQFDCVKIDKPLMINVRGQHSSGPRAATGRQWSEAVGKMITDAREEGRLEVAV